jgi:hypothetical protein
MTYKIVSFMAMVLLVLVLLWVSGIIKMPLLSTPTVTKNVEEVPINPVSHDCHESKYNTVSTYNCNRALAPCHPTYTKPCENACVR